MANHASDDSQTSSNEASGFSTFGGHLLAAAGDAATLGSDSQALVATLQALGIEDAEQVVAMAAIPDVRAELQHVLALKEKAFQQFLDRVSALLPATRAAEYAQPGLKDRGLGAKLPTPEMLAELSAAEAAPQEGAPVGLPTSVNLVSFFNPIRSQGSRGTCVSYTLTALNEYIKRRTGLVRDLSEQHLYYEIKLVDGAAASCGTWQVKAVPALSARGQCREAVWPYLNALPCNNHGPVPASARPDGLSYRLATLAVPARNVAQYKLQMSRQRPVTISIPVYNSWYASAAVRTTGRITMRIGNEAVIGGHAVILVGYVDTASSPGGGYFIVRNSWGTTGFGSACPFGAGYGTIPYQYITNDCYEAYTAVVPGINSVMDEDQGTNEDSGDGQTKASTVTIQVGSNVKITIETR